MKTKIAFGICTLITLAACTGGSKTGGLRLSDETRQIERTLTSTHEARNYAFPKSSADEMVQALKKYCGQPSNEIQNIENRLLADGYKLFGTTGNGAKIFNNTNGSPTIIFNLDYNRPNLGNSFSCVLGSGYKAGIEDNLKAYINSLPGFVPLRSNKSKLLVSKNVVIEEENKKELYAVDARGFGVLGTVIRLHYIKAKQ